jgi:LacI family transcriptional regulator
MRAVVRRAWERELVVLVAEDTGDEETEKAYERLLAQARIDGLIVTSASAHSSLPGRVIASGAPCVFAGRGVAGSGRNVRLAEEPISRLSVEHFARLGHSCVGHATGPVDASDIIERRVTSFQAAAKEFGLKGRIERGSLDETGGAAATERLLAAEQAPTAILVTNFNQVFGAIAAIRARGLEIPRDVSVIAADDDPVFDFRSRRRRRFAAITPSSAQLCRCLLIRWRDLRRDVELSRRRLIERSTARPPSRRPPSGS